MKKFLSYLLYAILTSILTVGFFIWYRYDKNPELVVPYPYTFSEKWAPVQIDSPILIVGDRMADYLSKFQINLSETISTELSAPIKIQSLASPGEAIHRTIHKLKSISKWPQILIYHGASEEFTENKFNLSQISKIKGHFSIYNNEKIQTLLMLYPWLSRIVYEPIERVQLANEISPDVYEEKNYLVKLETELLLFEKHLVELIETARNRGTFIIFLTTPINLNSSPKKTCHFATNDEIEKHIIDLRELLKQNNPKEAYNRSSDLIKKFVGNAELFYFHGQISKRLGYYDEALRTLQIASSYDCEPWRATEVHNSIIRKVAKNYQVLLFDFAQMTNNDLKENITFFDEIYPENKYYEAGMHQLGLVVKKILKL